MLQYHVPAQDIARMLRGQKYEPYGFVQKHPYIKHVTSISDLISKVYRHRNWRLFSLPS